MTDSFQLSSILLCSSHPQLVQLIDRSAVSQDLRRQLVQKKSAHEERSILPTVGAVGSSTTKPASPRAGGVNSHCSAACHIQ